jgi:hypothetical protein
MNNPRRYAAGTVNNLRSWRFAATLCVLLGLAACGGGGAPNSPTPTSTNPTPPPVPLAASDAARLLEQATFGVTASDIAHVQAIGVDAYITEQMAYSPTQYTGYSYTPHTAPVGCMGDGSNPPDASSLCARALLAVSSAARFFHPRVE